MRVKTLLMASAIAACPLVAQAQFLPAQGGQPIAGPYIGLEGGANFLMDENVKSVGGVKSTDKLQANTGAIGVATVGWGFGNGLRAEVEFDYRTNNLGNVETPAGGITASGKEQKYGPMVNIAYDFNGLSPWVVPYLGAGVGYQWAKDREQTTGGAVLFTGNSGAFAYQAIAGVAIPIAQVPGLAITAEYRFMGLAGNRNYSSAGGTAVVDNDYNHSVLVGFRYAFGAPPPPAPIIPVAEVGAKTFLVFFDWDRADLTARSEGIIQDAASYSQGTHYTRIDVDGNTDTSGTPTYNQGLSERRARVVAAQLVRDGVPQSAITMHAYGDTHLLVPTGPNVREPQNRRVDIVYH
jgi:OOP family OmpA-OmpF porin